jgi:hypothetical protein
LLSRREKIPSLDRELYLPYVYQNLGCFLAELAAHAAQSGQSKEAERLSRETVEVIADGVEEFKKTEKLDSGLKRLRNGVRQELGGGGDFSTLGVAYRDELEKLIRDKRRD